jgi:hypothetical protein
MVVVNKACKMSGSEQEPLTSPDGPYTNGCKEPSMSQQTTSAHHPGQPSGKPNRNRNKRPDRELRCSSCGAEFLCKSRGLRCRPCERRRKQQEHAERMMSEAYAAEHRRRKREAVAKRRVAERAATIAAYGGKCECCGESHHEFLGIDHVNGNGAEHRRSIRKGCGLSFYRWLQAQGYPKEEFRLLCWNCNLARGFYGYCPHERNHADQ